MGKSEISLSDIEARLVRLEEGLWFQEKNLKELDGFVQELQKRQTSLSRQIEQNRSLIINMRDALESRSLGDPRAEVPPHYQQKK